MGLVIPLFIPHRGCPHQCAFCNQESITGQNEGATVDIVATIEEWLGRERKRPPEEKRRVEVAFYGGSFSCLERDVQRDLLGHVAAYLKSGEVAGVRISTRPDCIDPETVAFLKAHGVSTVELGVQSLDDRVLETAQRGHSAEESVVAVTLLKRAEISVGMQMMVGLPGETRRSYLAGLEKLVLASPDFVRLYPVLVIKGAELEAWYEKGLYKPLSLAEAVVLAARFKDRMACAGIEVIRIGLQATQELENVYVAGPWHPSFGEMVDSYLFFKALRARLYKLKAGEKLRITLSHRDLSMVQGLKKRNIVRLQALGLGDRLQLVRDEDRLRGDFLYEILPC